MRLPASARNEKRDQKLSVAGTREIRRAARGTCGREKLGDEGKTRRSVFSAARDFDTDVAEGTLTHYR
jgi:hypothetical protein